MAQLIAFILFGGLAVVLLVVGLGQVVQQRRLLDHAEPVDAVITHSQVFSSTSTDTDARLGRSNSTTTHRPDVKFRYTVAGSAHESDLLYPTSIARTYASAEAAAAELAPFALNASVRAWVNPAMPDKAFLLAEKSQAPLVFIVLGVLLPPLAWFVGRWL